MLLALLQCCAVVVMQIKLTVVVFAISSFPGIPQGTKLGPWLFHVPNS